MTEAKPHDADSGRVRSEIFSDGMVIKMSFRNRKTKSSGQWGGSVLELALLLPALFMLSFGLVDYSYYFYLKSSFQAAASAAARAAIPSSATNTTVTNIVSNMMTASGIPSTNYTLSLSPSNIGTATQGTTLTVTISTTW